MPEIEDHQLQNLVTIKYMRQYLDEKPGGRRHPLIMRRHEQGRGVVDYSIAPIELPRHPKNSPRNEAQEMLQPLARLCERVGETFPHGWWKYRWYYFELLDRDERLQPVCWIDPQLLDRPLPIASLTGDPLRQRPAMKLAHARRLRCMDAAAKSDSVSTEKTDEWRDWLRRAWRAYEKDWLEEGALRYESPEPWSSVLGYDPDRPSGASVSEFAWTKTDNDPPPHHHWSDAGFPGLYWRMLPLYDARRVDEVWLAMKDELFVTSVFNLGATANQDEKLWERMKGRFVLSCPRMPRYKYLVRLREQKVLQWSREGLTIEQMGWELINHKLATLDEEEARRIADLPPHKQRRYHVENAMRQVRRIRRRLREEGELERRQPGRPPKSE